jgi:hypothetical protein
MRARCGLHSARKRRTHPPNLTRRALAEGVPATGLLSRLARVMEYARWLTTSHPSPTARVDADPGASDRWEGGFAFTAAAGLVAMVTFQSVYFVLVDLLGFTGADPGLPSDLALAVASLLWATVIVPSWTQRVNTAARTGSSAPGGAPWPVRSSA